ncbi:transcriptional regulatory protein [Asticcacaulis excentricus]|uniref:Transcriptional regulatory protein n=2 Tax=Asticcacaulis excentricus TaxID=78587 RepID=A0A3G9G5G7_9CAUL|nr:transcriptional regulatory protein [Asticcacaulis excentricus]
MAAALCLGALYFLHAAFPEALKPLVAIIATGPLVFNRAVGLGLGLTPRPLKIDAALLVLLVGLSGIGHVFSALQPVWDVVSLYLFFELPVRLWRRLPGDLLNARRRASYALLAIGTLLGAGVAVASILGRSAPAATVGAFLTLCLCLATAAFGGELKRTLTPERSVLNVAETRLLQRVRTEMAETYADPNLTLSRLAQRLGVAEHHLRRVIHAGEGEEHFSRYLNRWRIESFKARAKEEGTILELALSVGYNSLSAFNRAFKASEGVTPSAFRAALKAKTSETMLNTADTPSGQ